MSYFCASLSLSIVWKIRKNKIRTFSGMDEKWQTKRARKVTEHGRNMSVITSLARPQNYIHWRKKTRRFAGVAVCQSSPPPFCVHSQESFLPSRKRNWSLARSWGHVSSLRRLPVLVERTVRMTHNQKMDEWRMRNSAVQLIR